jgi:hypothetical protein
MAIEDLQKNASLSYLETDICVIGAGPAGISFAHQLIGSGIRLVLAESGGWADEPRTQALYEGESVGHPMTLTEGRHRRFGGTSTYWGGRVATLDQLDFAERSWVNDSGWPISWKTMEPFYEQAKTKANFKAPWLPEADALNSINRKLPILSTEKIKPFIWRSAPTNARSTLMEYLKPDYSKHFDWGKAYKQSLSTDTATTIVVHSNLIRMTSSQMPDEIASAIFSSLNGNILTIKARYFVICCSGIENARILLNLPEPIISSVNKHDNIGRYFMQHPRGLILSLTPKRTLPPSIQDLFNNFVDFRRSRVGYEVGLALSEDTQKELKLLNASAACYYTASASSPWEAGKRVRDAIRRRSIYPTILGDIRHFLSGGGATFVNVLRRYISDTPRSYSDADAHIVVDLEQEPNRCSKITLAETTDELGVTRVRVDWKLGEAERRTARVFATLIAEELSLSGYGACELQPWLNSIDPIKENELVGNYHFIGATRMSNEPEQGVVDKDCRVFGLKNLFVGGASIFPTGGHANPTLTIVALAIRLAEHLRKLALTGAA